MNSILYSLILFISGTLALIVIVVARKTRKTLTSRIFILLMLSMLVWNWTYAFFWRFPDWPGPYFWLNMTYVGAVSAPVLVFIYALDIIGAKNVNKWYHFAGLSVEPALTLIILWTDRFHHLFFGDFPRSSFIYNGGPWFWINIIYSYGLLAVAYFLLIKSALTARARIFRQQILLSIAGISIPIIASLIGVFGFHPLPGLDLIPISFLLGSFIFMINLASYQSLDLLPVAHDLLIDQMSAGMIVLDFEDRIVDINPAATRLIGLDKDMLIGKFKAALGTSLASILQNPACDTVIFQNSSIHGQSGLTLSVKALPLFENHVNQGRIVLIQDITELKKVESDLREANETLSKQLGEIARLKDELKEQVIRDPLTGLFNRRVIDETIVKELSRMDREGSQMCILMLDIDRFKTVNDTYGHDAGDLVLVELSDLLRKTVRESDWVIRFGGEEIMILLMDTGIDHGTKKAGEIRELVEALRFSAPEMPSGITVSIGVAEYPAHGRNWEEIVVAADEELYKAKATGRNRVCSR